MRCNWQKCDNEWYEKRTQYNMTWDIDDISIRRGIIAVASNGGPIAILNSSSKSSNLLPNFELTSYTNSGKLIANISWLDHIPVTIGWCSYDILVCVFADGTVRTFSPFLDQLSIFHLKNDSKSDGCIILAKISPYGIFFVTALYQVYYNASFFEPDYFILTNIPLRCNPLEITWIFCPCDSIEKTRIFPTSIFLPLEDSSIAILNIWDPHITSISSNSLMEINPVDPAYFEISSTENKDDKFLAFALSPKGKFMAFLTQSCKFTVLRTSNIFAEPVMSYNFGMSFSKLKQMVWCGDDSIVISALVPVDNVSNLPSMKNQKAKNIVYIGGHNNQWLSYLYGKQSTILLSEVDGVKIITSNVSDFIYKIPDPIQKIFGIGSCEPSAMLFFAYEKYKSGDITSYHSLRSISPNIIDASKVCIEASIYQYHNLEVAIALLRAASFGKAYSLKINNFDKSVIDEWEKLFIEACRDLRIVHAIKKSEAEIEASVEQIRFYGYLTLTSRLANHKCHLLALRICEYSMLNIDHILSNWASNKIKNSLESTDEELAEIILAKVLYRQSYKNLNSSCIASIADIAAKLGRPHLATMIIYHENDVNKRVNMLLQLPSFKLAAEQAIKAKNMELIYKCVQNLLSQSKQISNTENTTSSLSSIYENQCSQKQYWSADIIDTLVSVPNIVPFLIYYCQYIGESMLLLKLFEQMENFVDAGWIMVMLACQKDIDLSIKLEHLAHAAAYFTSSIKINQTSGLTNKSQASNMIKALNIARNLSSPQDSLFGNSFIQAPCNGLDSSFEREVILAEIELIQYQINLDSKAKQASWNISNIPDHTSFVGLSLAKTIESLAFLGLIEDLEIMKNILQIPDQIFSIYKIKGLALGQHFEEVLNFVQLSNKVPVIGYERIIEICIDYDARHIAAKFIPKLKDLDRQVFWYNRAGMHREAQAIRTSQNSSVQSKIMERVSDAIHIFGVGTQ
ncbi:N-terminal domain-containing protein [Cryptosporidium andersoni]|uniref:N-terminal domain-containing protein n=1 Tax=Cryptosporidium andersoni TaxID=117008 RepID=A0A1J4MX06_9CRYT|nr:N-terminal domain-containing protein [Cryptosporidium andersoni]